MQRDNKSVDDMMAEQQSATLAREEHALIAWSNTFLARRQLEIASSLTELSDGVLLINLAEVAWDERVGAYQLRPKVLAHKIDNISSALRFLKERDVLLLSLSAQDIAAGKVKQTVFLLWNILRCLTLRGILRLRSLQGGGGGGDGSGGGGAAGSSSKQSVRDAVLSWVNESTGVSSITDFSSSFRDGVALSHIVNSLVPGSIDLDKVTPDNARENVAEALRVAEEELGIPSLLSVDDFSSAQGPDETAVENFVCMLVSASQARVRSDAEVAALKEAAASANEKQQSEMQRLQAEAEEERAKFAAVAADLARLKEAQQESAAGQASLEEELERARAERAELMAALERLEADSGATHARLETALAHESKLVAEAGELRARVDESGDLLKARDDELSAANAELYRLHREQTEVLANVRSELNLKTIAENEDASEADVDANIFRRQVLQQRSYADFISMLPVRKGYLMKRRPGKEGTRKIFGVEKKKRYFVLKGDVLYWYKAPEDKVPKGKAKLKHYQPIEFLPPSNEQGGSYYGARGSVAENTLTTDDGKQEEIVLRMEPLDGVKESQAKVMELSALSTMVPELSERAVEWIEDINTRIALIHYLGGLSAKAGQISREMVEFVAQRKEAQLSLENTAFDSYDAFMHFRDCLVMRRGLRLHLSNVALSDPTVKIIAEVLSRNDTTESLEFPRNLLTAEAARALAGGMRKNHSLRAISLDFNKVGDEGVQALADAVRGHRGLSDLSLTGVSLTDAGAEALCDALAAQRAAFAGREFPVLKLARNQVGDPGAAAVARLIAADPSVRVLNLESNTITDRGAASIAEALANSGVQELNLAGNQVGNRGLAAIAAAVQSCSRSVAVDLSRNPLITADGARSLLSGEAAVNFHKLAFIFNA